MTSTLVRGKYVICKVTGTDSADVVSDGAVFQQDGEIVEVGSYDDLKSRHPEVDVIGSPSYVVMPGLVNDHFHVASAPFRWGRRTCRLRCGAYIGWVPGQSIPTWTSCTEQSR